MNALLAIEGPFLVLCDAAMMWDVLCTPTAVEEDVTGRVEVDVET